MDSKDHLQLALLVQGGSAETWLCTSSFLGACDTQQPWVQWCVLVHFKLPYHLGECPWHKGWQHLRIHHEYTPEKAYPSDLEPRELHLYEGT